MWALFLKVLILVNGLVVGAQGSMLLCKVFGACKPELLQTPGYVEQRFITMFTSSLMAYWAWKTLRKPAPGATRESLEDYQVLSEAALGPRYEARSWLKASENEAPFASNRFQSERPSEALAFVDSLYAAGAVDVSVTNVTDDGVEGAYADALIVTLPDKQKSRAVLINIFRKEMDEEEPEIDESNELYFWWD